MKKVYIEHSSAAYIALFMHLGFEVTDNVESADLFCFTGGSDVSPSYYGDASHRTTGADAYRDAKEARLFHVIQGMKKPSVGICRGGQFLNVMSGGRMYQDVTGHGLSHHITDCETGETVYVSSTHHQMMMPGEKAIMVAYGAVPSQRQWYDGEIFKRDASSDNVEVVYYKDTNCLCFQPHPEFGGVAYQHMQTYFRSLLERFLSV